MKLGAGFDEFVQSLPAQIAVFRLPGKRKQTQGHDPEPLKDYGQEKRAMKYHK